MPVLNIQDKCAAGVNLSPRNFLQIAEHLTDMPEKPPPVEAKSALIRLSMCERMRNRRGFGILTSHPEQSARPSVSSASSDTESDPYRMNEHF